MYATTMNFLDTLVSILVAAFAIAAFAAICLGCIALTRSSETAALRIIATIRVVVGIPSSVVCSVVSMFLTGFGIQSGQHMLTIIGLFFTVFNVVSIPDHYFQYLEELEN